MGLPNNDYAMRDINARRLRNGAPPIGGIRTAAAPIAGSIGCFALVALWFVLKVLPIWIFIVNLIWLVQAMQQGTVGQFNFTWLIISAVLSILI